MNSSKKIWQKLLVNDFSYGILKPFIFIAERLKASRQNYLTRSDLQAQITAANQLFEDRVVRHGPFAGMKLSEPNSNASANYAKLLGSYETEIHPFFAILLATQYSSVINIGADDGYYAIGLALKMPTIPVLAYETNPIAQAKIKKNATLNKVQNVQVLGTYHPAMLAAHDAEKRSLFIVDCEGGEKDIFTNAYIQKLLHTDLIIELHLHVYPELETHFTQLFSATHQIEIVECIPDHVKVKTYHYPELQALDYAGRRFILEERDVYMQWIMLRSKLHAQ